MFVRAQAVVSLSPLAGRGWGEGASPLGAELRCSESRRGPLTLLASLHSRCYASAFLSKHGVRRTPMLSPRAGRGESQYRAHPNIPPGHCPATEPSVRSPHLSRRRRCGSIGRNGARLILSEG